MSRYIVRIESRQRKRGLTVAEYLGTYAAASPVAALCKAGRDSTLTAARRRGGRSAVFASAVLLPAEEMADLTARR